MKFFVSLFGGTGENHPEPMSEEIVDNELPGIGFLKILDEEDRRLLGDYGTFQPVHEGQEMITEGKPQGHLYFVISGKLRVTTEISGKTTQLDVVGPGETLGEINLFDPATASATVEAVEFSQVWRIGRYDFDAFMDTYPLPTSQLLAGMMGSVAKRLRKTNERLALAESEAALSKIW